jgi:hypothetical protein
MRLEYPDVLRDHLWWTRTCCAPMKSGRLWRRSWRAATRRTGCLSSRVHAQDAAPRLLIRRAAQSCDKPRHRVELRIPVFAPRSPMGTRRKGSEDYDVVRIHPHGQPGGPDLTCGEVANRPSTGTSTPSTTCTATSSAGYATDSPPPSARAPAASPRAPSTPSSAPPPPTRTASDCCSTTSAANPNSATSPTPSKPA